MDERLPELGSVSWMERRFLIEAAKWCLGVCFRVERRCVPGVAFELDAEELRLLRVCDTMNCSFLLRGFKMIFGLSKCSLNYFEKIVLKTFDYFCYNLIICNLDWKNIER